jgi:hypothetical protein
MADEIIRFPKKGAKDDDANRVGIDRDGDSSPLSVSVPALLEKLIRDGMSQDQFERGWREEALSRARLFSTVTSGNSDAADAAYDQGLLDGREQQEDSECDSQQERDLVELEQLREAEKLAKDLVATFRRRGLPKPARTVGLACIYQGFLNEHWDD